MSLMLFGGGWSLHSWLINAKYLYLAGRVCLPSFLFKNRHVIPTLLTAGPLPDSSSVTAAFYGGVFYVITSLNQFKLVDSFLLNRDKFSEAFCLIWFKCIEFLATASSRNASGASWA